MTTALDLFAGTGWGVACQQLDIDEVGVENMAEALASRAAAGMTNLATTNVWDVDYAAFRGLFTLLIASPPCQTFSLAGKGAGRAALDNVLRLIKDGTWKSIEALRAAAAELGDERTALVLAPLHAAWEMRPEAIALEQVPTVLPVWEAIADVLRSWGYSVWVGIIHAEQYGVPQTRKRAILMAHRDREVKPPTPTHSRYYSRSPEKLDEGVQKWVSMAEALGWGPGVMISNYGSGGDPANRGERLTTQPAPTVTSKIDRNVVHFERTHMGDVYNSNGCIRSVDEPAPTMTGSMDNGNFRWMDQANPPAKAVERVRAKMVRPDECANIEWPFNRPSPTIVGSFAPDVVAAPGYRKAGDGPRQNTPGSIRVTIQEAAILQSYPADFEFAGAKTRQFLQVGNAVPPLMAAAVLRQLVKA